MLVETTKIEELVSRLQTNCRVNAQEILAESTFLQIIHRQG